METFGEKTDSLEESLKLNEANRLCACSSAFLESHRLDVAVFSLIFFVFHS